MTLCNRNCASCVQSKIASIKFTRIEAQAPIHSRVSRSGLTAIHSHGAADGRLRSALSRLRPAAGVANPPHQTQPRTRVFILG